MTIMVTTFTAMNDIFSGAVDPWSALRAWLADCVSNKIRG
jgi:hypothetical protein